MVWWMKYPDKRFPGRPIPIDQANSVMGDKSGSKPEIKKRHIEQIVSIAHVNKHLRKFAPYEVKEKRKK